MIITHCHIRRTHIGLCLFTVPTTTATATTLGQRHCWAAALHAIIIVIVQERATTVHHCICTGRGIGGVIHRRQSMVDAVGAGTVVVAVARGGRVGIQDGAGESVEGSTRCAGCGRGH